MEEIADYLERHQDVAELLSEVCQSARAEFGEQAELSLELYRDPEIADQYLTLYVRQPAYDRQIMARIENVRSHYRDKLSARSAWLHVTTDFRPPGIKPLIGTPILRLPELFASRRQRSARRLRSVLQ